MRGRAGLAYTPPAAAMSNPEESAPPPAAFPPPSLMLKPGDVVGDRYEIVRLIGEGGMGSVFEARHKVLGRAVAIKVLKPEIARHEQFAQRFLVEAKAAAELHHRNIVELNDYGVDDGRPYMVMEILRGESLSVLIHREGPLSMERVVALFEPVLRALAMAHDKGVIHRDIKPENLFLVREDDGEVTPKVVDFGIAKRAEESVQLTSANMALGTPAYMAPEQIMSSRTVTGAADQYAVGVTMYESLTKRNPYNADTLNAFIVAKATQDPGPLGELRPDLDPRFVAVIMKTLARKPEDRFPSVTALREALAPFRQGSSLRPPPMDAPPRPPQGTVNPLASTTAGPTFGTPPAVSVNSTPAPPVAPAPPSRAGLWVGLALVVVAAVAGVAVLATRGAGGSAPQPPTTQPQAPQAPPTQVVFAVEVEPREATIRLDGEVIGTGRAQVLRPHDGQSHQLAITAPGYATVTEVLTASGDVRIERQLQRTPEVAPPTPPPTPTVAQPTPRGHGRTPTVATPTPTPTPPAPTPTVAAPTPTPPAPTPTEPAPPPRRTHDPNHPQVDPTNPFETH